MIKFLDISHLDIDSIAVLVAFSGQGLIDLLRDRRKSTRWSSESSNDTITETIDIDFGALKDVDYIQLVNHNLKQFTIKYDVAGTPTDFSVPINETTNTSTNNIYNNFTKINTQKIYVTAIKTITANEEKKIAELIVTELLGTFSGFPIIKAALSRNKIVKKLVRGKKKIANQDQTMVIDMEFKRYPIETDMALIETLDARTNPFYILLSGNQENLFTNLRDGWKNEDIRLYGITSKYEPNYTDNIISLRPNFKIKFEEV